MTGWGVDGKPEGGALAGAMMTEAGELDGEGDAEGSGGGVTCVWVGRGIRICGPPGAIGSGTNGEGVGEGDDDAAGDGEADAAGVGEASACATIAAGGALDRKGGIPQPVFISATT